MSTDFKTQGAYGFQMILLASTARRIFVFYIGTDYF
jgi:hypothetical protein